MSNEIKFFTEEGRSESEILNKIYNKYGEDIEIIDWKNNRSLFHKPLKCTWCFKERKNFSEEKEKEKIIELKNNHEIKIESSVVDIKNQIKDLKNLIINSKEMPAETVHPTIKAIQEILEENDFSKNYIKNIIEKIESELTQNELNDIKVAQRKVFEWISDTIKIYDGINLEKKNCLALIGITGVGKTTTVGRLFQFFEDKNIIFFNTDAYKVGAIEQLEKIATVTEIPYKHIDNNKDFKIQFMYNSSKDLIIIDTPGRSPKDYIKLQYLKDIFKDNEVSIEYTMVLNATIREKDMKEILKEFATFDYSSLIFTKLDEAMTVGTLISVSNEINKPLYFFTDGQTPKDICRSTKKYLLNRLVGFDKMNRLL